MGFAKRLIEIEEARGFRSIGDKFACADCVDESYIRKIIQAGATSMHCSYCNRSSRSRPIAVHVDKLAGLIVQGFRSEWGTPSGQGMGWDSEEGEWWGSEVFSLYEMLTQVAEVSNDGLLDDLILSIQEEEWCERDPYGLKWDEVLRFGWENFCNIIKHHSRYVFFRLSKRLPSGREEEIPPAAFLDSLGKVLAKIKPFRAVPPGKPLFRCRTHGSGVRLISASELGTASNLRARFPNRMSPAGIAMFYCAFDRDTALAETPPSPGDTHATIGTFRPVRTLRVLDLSNLPAVPSVFDSTNHVSRRDLAFLHAFTSDLSKPIKRAGLEHIEYVPTQVVTEYVRHIYHPSKGKTLDGILYPSSRRPGGKACVLFVTADECCDLGQVQKGKKVVLHGRKRVAL